MPIRIWSIATTNWLATTYSYEPHRNVKTQVSNAYGINLISQYDYQYDSLTRRTSVVNSGQAFSAAAFNRYNYNDRNELDESARYLGANINDLTSPVQSEYRGFDYDPIGNRENITVGAQSGSYTANNVNQYTDEILPGGRTKTYDFDEDGKIKGLGLQGLLPKPYFELK